MADQVVAVVHWDLRLAGRCFVTMQAVKEEAAVVDVDVKTVVGGEEEHREVHQEVDASRKDLVLVDLASRRLCAVVEVHLEETEPCLDSV